MGGQQKIKVLATLICIIGLLGCANYSHIDRQIPAPTKQSESGILYKASSQQMVLELNHLYPNAKLRPLYEKQNLYEVFGMTLSELKSYDENAIVHNNKVVTKTQNYNWNPTSSLPLQQQINTFLGQCGNNSALNTTALKYGTEPKYNNTYEDTQAIEILNESHFSMKRSFWVVSPPVGSKINDSPRYKKSLQFQPDMAGKYTILQLAEDYYGNCYKNTGEILVTSNPEYSRAQADTIENFSMDLFYHITSTDAYDAWSVSKGDDVTIAIIDSGVNYNHPSLNRNIKTNDLEIPNNGIDDDNNGLIDDYLGYDFFFNDNKPYDDLGHGTHVAGLAAASNFGIAPNAKILALKALSPIGSGDLGSIAGAILYAIDQDVDIINLSLSFESKELPLWNLIFKAAEAKGVLFVTASGNGDTKTGIGYDLEVRPNYPASYNYSNVITVAASSKETVFTSYSNYSNKVVDVVAPGGSQKNQLLSAYIENPSQFLYGPGFGTSMATPIVSGVVALMKSIRPDLTSSEIREILLNSGQEYLDLRPLAASSRIISASQAVNATQSLNSQLNLANNK